MKVCILCGRKGTRGFVISSGGPGQVAGRLSYACAGTAACGQRQHRLTPRQAAVLGVLLDGGQRSPCEPGTRSDVLRRLRDRGMVARAPRGQWHIRPAGREAYGAYTGGRPGAAEIQAAARPPEPGWAGVYRCTGCGHGRRLSAWGNASVCGPLNSAGEIDSFEWDEVWQVHEDSIQCSQHPGAGLEKNIGGRWHRWHNCPCCGGSGMIRATGSRNEPRRCPADGFPDLEQGARLVHGAWWPADEALPPSPMETGGHRFAPGGDPRCRICRASMGSTAGRGPCPRDGHSCPAAVAEGDSETAHKMHGRDGWFCGQPGIMSGTFTAWRCPPRARRHPHARGRRRGSRRCLRDRRPAVPVGIPGAMTDRAYPEPGVTTGRNDHDEEAGQVACYLRRHPGQRLRYEQIVMGAGLSSRDSPDALPGLLGGGASAGPCRAGRSTCQWDLPGNASGTAIAGNLGRDRP